MKKIPLTQGQVALVDDADYEWLSRWKWCAMWCSSTDSFYAVRHIRLPNGKWTTLRMHRAILGLKRGDSRQVDRIQLDLSQKRWGK